MSDAPCLLANLERLPPATDQMIAECERQLNLKLPSEYVDFLKITNGGEGFIGENSYVMFWRVEELAAMNEAYEVSEYAPGLILFGSDGGGEAYGFDARTPQCPVVQVPFVGMSWELMRPLGASFKAFLKCLHEAE